MVATPLSSLLMHSAANNRHGITLAPQQAILSKSDIGSITHVGVPHSLANDWNSASGGVSFDPDRAHLAAIGESIERYCAAIADIEVKHRDELETSKVLDAKSFSLFSEQQQSEADFPYSNIYADTCLYSQVYSMSGGEEYWAPNPLIVLRDDFDTKIPTSSGLAAGTTTLNARLQASQELIERDALMTTWMHSLPGKRIPSPDYLQALCEKVGAQMYVFDITPAYSPFPVIAVSGIAPERGKLRFSLGAACKNTLHEAIEKAFLEWSQGIYFAGVFAKHNETSHLKGVNDVNSFDDHAIFYSVHPELVEELPLFADKDIIHEVLKYSNPATTAESLDIMIEKLSGNNIELYYRDLTTIDSLQAGVRVVRVIAPALVPIHAHHRWPFLGGTAQNLKMRYPDATSTAFPNSYPHPLG